MTPDLLAWHSKPSQLGPHSITQALLYRPQVHKIVFVSFKIISKMNTISLDYVHLIPMQW